MEIKDLLKKLRRYEIEIRKAVTTQMHGDFHSVFKGSGIEFDDIRQYQYGDDVRTINWNVSAKGHGTFVKTFKEEKDQAVYFILDVSASQKVGQKNQQKLDILKEVTGVLTLSAIHQQSNVGAICFSDIPEKVIPPKKGQKHAYQIITDLFKISPKSKGTDLGKAIKYSLGLIKRKSVVILISDFKDINFMDQLKWLAKKHDLIAIHLFDPLERNISGLGIVPVQDNETGKTYWLNTSLFGSSQKFGKKEIDHLHQLEKLATKYQIDWLSINTRENFVPTLVKLFKVRNKAWKRE